MPDYRNFNRKVKMIVVNRAVLKVQLCLFFLLKDFTQADFEVGDNYILEVEGQRTGVERYQSSEILSVLGKAVWLELNIITRKLREKKN